MEKDLNHLESNFFESTNRESISQAAPFAMLIHFSTLLSLIFPFAGFIIACVLWLYKKHESNLIYQCGLHALNFQLSTFFYILFCLIFVIVALVFNVSFLKIIIISSVMIILCLYIYWFIFTFVAGFKAAKGQAYRIPLTIPVIRTKKKIT